MAWNEPGGNKPRDPWGGRGGDQGPPDLDEVLNNLRRRFGGMFGGGGNGQSGSPLMWLPVAAVLLVLYLIWGFYTVEQQERAVVLSFGKFDRTVGPGLNWHWPPVEQHFKVSTEQQRRYELTQEMLTADTNIVRSSLEVEYLVIDPKAYLLRVSAPEEVLHHASESALRHVIGGMSMDEALIELREQIPVEVKTRLQEYLDRYNTGISVVKVVLDKTEAPLEVQDAFDEVAKAKEDEERFKKEAEAYANSVVPEARGQAQRILEDAMAYREKRVAEAQGDADRFSDLLAEYRKAPQVTRERLYLETLEEVYANNAKVLIDVQGGDSMMYLPLDKILEKSGRTLRELPASPGGTGVQAPAAPSTSTRGYGSRSRELR